MERGLGKNLNSSYLYQLRSETGTHLTEMIMKGERVDKQSTDFDVFKLDVSRRQYTSLISRVLEHPDVVLVSLPTHPLPKSLRVFTSVDIKYTKTNMKVFIDISDCARKTETGWKIYRVDVLVAYLLTASIQLMYYSNPKVIVNNSQLNTIGTQTFCTIFNYIVNYLFKINSIEYMRNRCNYLAALYYQVTILGKDLKMDSVQQTAKKLAGINDREVDIINVFIQPNTFNNINTFIETCAKALKLPTLTTNIVFDKWAHLLGTGTIYATELFPAFATMLTDAYSGAYINNQNTLEKIVGTNVTKFTKAVLELGGDVIK